MKPCITAPFYNATHLDVDVSTVSPGQVRIVRHHPLGSAHGEIVLTQGKTLAARSSATNSAKGDDGVTSDCFFDPHAATDYAAIGACIQEHQPLQHPCARCLDSPLDILTSGFLGR